MSSLFPVEPTAPVDSGEPADWRTSRTVVPVSLLVSSARLILERHLGLLWVSGEISGFKRAASGHCYFCLKDGAAQVQCVCYRTKAQFVGFPLKDGLSVEVRAVPSIYEARGEFQLNVETVRLAGVGVLYERYERMKERLGALGWFAAERKRALPALPRAVGIVTSPHGAALHDILTTLRRRWPPMPVIVYPTPVQGEGAAAVIAQAIAAANARAEVDVLIVARGGGSIEDLWAFNEEAVARAVFHSSIPIVSGVGHETDFTICDFVADLRAPTPTAAAALVVPDRDASRTTLAALAARCRRAALRALEERAQRVDRVAPRLVHPAARVERQRRDLAVVAARLHHAERNRIAAASGSFDACARRMIFLLRQPPRQVLRVTALRDALGRAMASRRGEATVRAESLGRALTHLNPRAVLERGYAIVAAADGALVDDAAKLAVGDEVTLAFARGSASATVRKVGG
jgi:exodeoxyribonuclease VII large subunit